MVDVLSALMPVLLVVAFGVILRKREVLSEKTVSELKFLLTNNILPVAVFHALAISRYSGGAWIESGLMLVLLLASFGIGMLMRPLVKPPYGKYVPFLVQSPFVYPGQAGRQFRLDLQRAVYFYHHCGLRRGRVHLISGGPDH